MLSKGYVPYLSLMMAPVGTRGSLFLHPVFSPFPSPQCSSRKTVTAPHLTTLGTPCFGHWPRRRTQDRGVEAVLHFPDRQRAAAQSAAVWNHLRGTQRGAVGTASVATASSRRRGSHSCPHRQEAIARRRRPLARNLTRPAVFPQQRWAEASQPKGRHQWRTPPEVPPTT